MIPTTKTTCMRVLGAGAMAIALSLCAQAQSQLGETPEIEELPAASAAQFGEALQEFFFERGWTPQSRYRDGPHIRAAFRPVVESARQATVMIRSDNKRIGWGGVVGPDGWVLTKASLLFDGPSDSLTCRLADDRELDARVVGIDREFDLAMLKVEASGLPTLELAEKVATRSDHRRGELLVSVDPSTTKSGPADGAAPTLSPGDWVATVGTGENPVAIGVVSVLPRQIQRRPGLLGVQIGNGEGGVLVTGVAPNTGAARAGIERDDLIRSVNGVDVASPRELRDAIMAKSPGEPVVVVVMRSGESGPEELSLTAILTGHVAHDRSHYQNQLGGELSKRRAGFTSVLQHDTVLEPRDCGGPLVDLDGRVIGFNIARAGRTESYALPADVVRGRLFDLMSGSLAP